MSVVELKYNLHQLIDGINNEEMLSKFYLFLSNVRDKNEGVLWNKLTKEEQSELLLSDDESERSESLISEAEMLAKHTKWL